VQRSRWQASLERALAGPVRLRETDEAAASEDVAASSFGGHIWAPAAALLARRLREGNAVAKLIDGFPKH
jgi:hypothetical protein